MQVKFTVNCSLKKQTFFFLKRERNIFPRSFPLSRLRRRKGPLFDLDPRFNHSTGGVFIAYKGLKDPISKVAEAENWQPLCRFGVVPEGENDIRLVIKHNHVSGNLINNGKVTLGISLSLNYWNIDLIQR